MRARDVRAGRKGYVRPTGRGWRGECHSLGLKGELDIVCKGDKTDRASRVYITDVASVKVVVRFGVKGRDSSMSYFAEMGTLGSGLVVVIGNVVILPSGVSLVGSRDVVSSGQATSSLSSKTVTFQ